MILACFAIPLWPDTTPLWLFTRPLGLEFMGFFGVVGLNGCRCCDPCGDQAAPRNFAEPDPKFVKLAEPEPKFVELVPVGIVGI